MPRAITYEALRSMVRIPPDPCFARNGLTDNRTDARKTFELNNPEVMKDIECALLFVLMREDWDDHRFDVDGRVPINILYKHAKVHCPEME